MIREKFIHKYGKKLKYFKSRFNLTYDYKKKEYLSLNKIVKGNIQYLKVYLINIILFSKCPDIITSQTGGSIVASILTEGFRHIKIYNLGIYT